MCFINNKNVKDRKSLFLLILITLISSSLAPVIVTCKSVNVSDKDVLTTINASINESTVEEYSSNRPALDKVKSLFTDQSIGDITLQTVRLATKLKERYSNKSIYNVTANVAKDLFIVQQKYDHIKKDYEEYKGQSKRLIFMLRIVVLLFVLFWLIKLFGNYIMKLCKMLIASVFKL